MNTILLKGQKVAIKSSYGFYLLECKEDIKTEKHYFKIKDVLFSDKFDSVEIIKGIKPLKLKRYRNIDLTFRFGFNGIEIYTTISNRQIMDYCEAFIFDRKKRSTEFKKELFFRYIDNFSFEDINKISIKSIEQFAKQFPQE